MKNWMKKSWQKMKAWVYALLVAIGIVSGGLALAVPVGYSWTNPTQNTDGSPFDAATEQAEVRLYCGVDPVAFVPETPSAVQSESTTAVSPGDATDLVVDLLPGTHVCFATVFDIYGYESGPSGTVTKIVERFPPSPPVLNNE